MNDVERLRARAMQGLRVDYFKAKFRAEYDRAQQIASVFKDAMEHYRDTQHCEGNYKVQKLSAAETGAALWAVEAWGEIAEGALFLPFEPWADWCERLDVRQAVDMHPKGVEALFNHLQDHGTGNRMLNWFSQRRRQKVGGRSGGGIGFAIGSHKSDFRMSVYQRGGEAGAVEFQLGGERLGRALDAINVMRENSPDMTDFQAWANMFTVLHSAGWQEAGKVTALSKGDTLGIISGQSLPPVDAATVVATIEEHLGRLSRDEQVEMFTVLQHRLFA